MDWLHKSFNTQIPYHFLRATAASRPCCSASGTNYTRTAIGLARICQRNKAEHRYPLQQLITTHHANRFPNDAFSSNLYHQKSAPRGSTDASLLHLHFKHISFNNFSSTASHKEISVPSMGDSITEGTLNHWKKQPGEAVTADEVVAIVDTDKVSVDINSPIEGVLVELKANAGDTIFVGNPLFVVDTAATPTSPATPKEESRPAALETSQQTVQKPPAASEAPSKAQPPASTPPSAPAPKPSAGTGSPAVTPERGEKRAPMSRMRLRIAERLKGAQNTAAMLTTFNECDMSSLMALRSEMNEGFQAAHGVKMGFVSAFLLAAAKSLKKMPEVNAYIEDKDIVFKDYADISVAVATPNGLMVPVIRNCDKKTWADLEKDLAELAARARKGQIALEEMSGGTFTVSNGGVYGSMLGTPLLNPPQSSILGMHGVTKRAVVRGNEIVIRPMMYLALTYDHRLIDGREAVLFLSSIRDYIEDPRKMLLDM